MFSLLIRTLSLLGLFAGGAGYGNLATLAAGLASARDRYARQTARPGTRSGVPPLNPA